MRIERITDRITLVCGDCMEYMRGVADNGFELAVVDPPYHITNARRGGAGKLRGRILNQSEKKFREWDVAPPEEYFSELKRVGRNRIIWGGNYFNLGPARGIICWDKCQPWTNFSQFELAYTSFDRPARIFRYDNRRGGKIHPTQKPVALYRWLYENYATEGDRILDTHLGSGSSAIAAYELGYEFVGIEIDEEYYENAKARLLEHLNSNNVYDTDSKRD